MEKYEEKLLGKIDFLHEKVLRECTKTNIFIEIVLKYQTAIKNFSKAIESIKTLNSEIIEETGNSLNLVFKNFQYLLNSHIQEFQECSSNILKTIINPIFKSKEKDENYAKEKELYNQYNKLKNIYNNLKLNSEKAKKEFDLNAKFCEKNIFNYLQNKLNILCEENEDIVKIEEKMNLSINNTKNLENKYIKSLEDANNAREKMVNKENELLKFYQKINYDFYYRISCSIIYILPIVKKTFNSLISGFNAAEERCKKLNIKQDLDIFINNNDTNLKPEPELIFNPYYPEAELNTKNISGNDKKELETLDINYNILRILKQNFRDIRTDINMDEEEKKYRLRYLCSEIFKIGPGKGFDSKEKDELIDLIKEPMHKSFFLITLSKQRTKGRFKRSEKLVKDLAEILVNILDMSQKNNDFESVKNCIILSETFYFEKEKDKDKNKKEDNIRKIYLFDYIKYFKWFQNIDFWEGIIEKMIQNEIKKNEEISIKNKTSETPEEIKMKISNIGFSIVLSYTSTMIAFNISKENIIKIVDIFVKKYEIEETIAQTINENVKSSTPPIEDEEDKKFFEYIENNFEKNKNNNLINTDDIINNEDNKNEIKKNNDNIQKEKKDSYEEGKNIFELDDSEEKNEEDNKEKNEINDEINEDNKK